MSGPIDEPGAEAKRRRIALALALLVLGAAAGSVARWRLRGEGGPAVARAPFPNAGLSTAAASLWNRLLSILGQPGSRRFTFDRLAALLLRRQGDAAAKAFAEEFMKDPELRAVWEEYSHAGDGVDGEWLLRRLSEKPAFAALLNRYALKPAFLAAGNAVAAELSEEIAQLAVAGAVAAKPPAFRGPVAEREGDSVRKRKGAAPRGNPVRVGKLKVFGLPPGAAGVRLGKETTTAAEAFKQLASIGSAPSLESGGEPLGTVKLGGAGDVRIPGMPACFPANQVERLVNACIEHDRCGFWDACASAGIEGVCAAACQNCGNCPARPAVRSVGAPFPGDPQGEDQNEGHPVAVPPSTDKAIAPPVATSPGGGTQYTPIYWNDPNGGAHAGVLATSTDGTSTVIGNDGQDFGGALGGSAPSASSYGDSSW